MTSPGLDLAWDRLPDYVTAADEPTGTLNKWLGSIAGQMDPALIPDFIGPILAGVADYTKGNRFFDLEEITEKLAVALQA